MTAHIWNTARIASIRSTIRSNLKPLLLLLTIPLSNAVYGLLNNGDRGAYSLMTDLDNSLPFLKIFIVPYILWYAYILFALVYLCVTDRTVYYRTMLAMHAGLLVCYGIYYVYQTTVPRPALAGDDPLTAMAAWIYANDQPYNCFPSIHCLTSFLVALGVHRSRSRHPVFNGFMLLAAGLIILSTLFVKQHALLDVLGAILLGRLVYTLAAAVWPAPLAAGSKRRPAARKGVSPYGSGHHPSR